MELVLQEFKISIKNILKDTEGIINMKQEEEVNKKKESCKYQKSKKM